MPDPLKNTDVRWRQRFENFRKALTQLSSAAALTKQRDLTKLEQQGLIQAFEFSHELAWNTVKDFLESPRRIEHLRLEGRNTGGIRGRIDRQRRCLDANDREPQCDDPHIRREDRRCDRP